MTASGSARVVSHKRKVPTMRPPISRPGPSRAQTATPTLTGRVSPADSVASARARTPKRKREPEVEPDFVRGEETNINVVVRCRGRSDREVRENSGVVVSTDGTKGKRVDLSMGPSALSNKTYHFDKVFSPAADQRMIFTDVVAPILDEVLNGFNCTIFAYGQTGTGKTYTMSGDLSDTRPVPDDAGIIPRVLDTLFEKLGDDGKERIEHDVKCSFIELYNEELRDLLAPDDHAKLKIFDDANKNGRTTTLVQGMEESHIKTAAKGLQLLRNGSYKRQVAATKCNDLSSRSHTVFTITVYTKRTSDSGEDFISCGKLNLVDLAGSENIQRSGAENKRAVEAGVINKSLLTLGRVINALVDRGSHIPYRESKLTRLLQDSLGGRTKTCIIATLSPAKSNLEETISTLDYAFRAKNIRNKPQVNQMMSKKTLLREFTSEIEKLKSDLIATRQRNGVYLTAEAWEELNMESESRRILGEEQRDKIEMTENKLKNKIQELFALTSSFQSLKKDNEQTKINLDSTKSVLEQTEIVLQHTRESLVEEAHLRQAHEVTEKKLHQVGADLLSNLETTTSHVGKLHSKLKRRSDLQAINRTRWMASQTQVTDVTSIVEQRLDALHSQQRNLIATFSSRMQSFVADELREITSFHDYAVEQASAFETSRAEVNAQTSQARDNMSAVLQEIGTIREEVKQKVGTGLEDLSAATQRISAGISKALDTLRSQLEESHIILRREFGVVFGDLISRMHDQQAEMQRLRKDITNANRSFVDAGHASRSQFKQAIHQEKETAAKERKTLLSQIASLVYSSAQAQDARMNGYLDSASKQMEKSEDEFEVAHQAFGDGLDTWHDNFRNLIDTSVYARDVMQGKLEGSWTDANEQTIRISDTAKDVHGETLRIVHEQLGQMDHQLLSLDEIVSRVRRQSEGYHGTHANSLAQLASDVQESYRSIGKHFETSHVRTQTLNADIHSYANELLETMADLSTEGDIRRPLRVLRNDISAAQIEEYCATGETPARIQYAYPTVLPLTEEHEILLSRIRAEAQLNEQNDQRFISPSKRSFFKLKGSPRKHFADNPCKTTTIFNDAQDLPTTPALAQTMRAHSTSNPSTIHTITGLRERDVNVSTAAGHAVDDSAPTAALTTGFTDVDIGEVAHCKQLLSSVTAPHLRRYNTNPLSSSLQPQEKLQRGANNFKSSKRGTRMTVADVTAGLSSDASKEKENLSLHLSASVGPGSSANGRWLRSRGSE